MVAVVTMCAFSSLAAQGYLPLTVDENTFYNDDVFISKDDVSASGSEIRTGDGWGAFTIAFADAPERLTLQYSSNRWGKDRVMTFQESPDNSSWTDIYVGDPPTSYTDLSVLLKLDTRYVRFSYTASYTFGDFWTKVGYVRDIQVGKALLATTDALSFRTEAGEPQTLEFDVAVTNLAGDLVLSCANEDFEVSPSSVSHDEALGSGTVHVTVTYRPGEAVSASDVLVVGDSGNEGNVENIALSGVMVPGTPVAGEATEVGSTSFVANWDAGGNFDVLLDVMHDGELLPDYTALRCSGGSYKVEGLQPGMTYAYQVRAVNGDLMSEMSNAVQVTLNVPSVTLGTFETFVTSVGEPVSQAVEVDARHLAGAVRFELKSGKEFSLDTDSLTADEAAGSVLSVTYTPLALGEANDTLVVSSPWLQTLSVPLSGVNALPAPQVLEATDVTNSGFTANWEAVEGATSYRLTVETADGEPLPSYNQIETGNVTSFVVTNLLPSTDYYYSVRSVAGGVVSDESSDLMGVTTFDGAVITYSHTPKDFVVVNGSSLAQTLRISGTNVFGGISASVTGSGAFVVDRPSLPVEGGLLTVTFNPDGFGVYDAVLNLTAQGAEAVSVALKGYSTPSRPEALPAAGIGVSSFEARWQKVSGATDYLLTVRRGANVVAAYDGLATGDVDTWSVTGLDEAVTYNYTVKAVADGASGEASDAIEVTTLYTPVVEVVSTSATSAAVRWNEPLRADSYLVTLTRGGSVVEGYDRLALSSAACTFDGLTPSTDYVCSVVAVFGGVEVKASDVAFTTTARPAAYGNQLNNSGFEAWEGSGDTYEPVDWNSFGTMTGSMSSMASMAGIRMEESSDVRPGTSGSKSVRIWTGSVFGVNANGNLTTGRINAGSMSAADPANHNFTVLGDEAFSERIDARPDSLTVWVKYAPANSASQARVAAIIHDEYSYRDPSGSDPQADSHVVGTAEMNYLSNGGGWQRLSIPFNYRGNTLSPDYMLVTFSSNMTPGGGDANDAVIVDDLHLVYKPQLTVSGLASTSYKAGDVLVVNYQLTGSMSVPNLGLADNVVRLELSDRSGSFASPRVIASMTTDVSGSLAGILPSDLEAGDRYKVRVVTTNYPMSAEVPGMFAVASHGNPSIDVDFDGVFEARIGSVPATRQISVKGNNLSSEIYLTLSSSVFTVSPDVLPATGGTVVVTYSPNVPGNDQASLVMKSAGAEDVVLTLRGEASAPSSLDMTADDTAELTVWPNPVIDVANLLGVDGDEGYAVYGIDGRMLMSGRLTGTTIDVSALAGGNYVLVVGQRRARFIK